MATIAASRVSGVAPLAIVVDGVGSYSWTDIIESTFLWDFGDGSEPVEGFLAHHVYETADTYTIALTVTRQGQPDEIDTQSITVTALSGTVRVVSTAGDYTDAPVGSTTYTSFASAFAALETGDTLLLRRGESHTATGLVNCSVAGPIYWSTFGSGALPNMDLAGNNIRFNADDWRVENLDIRNAGLAFEIRSDHVLVRNCTVDDATSCVSSDGEGYDFSRFKFFLGNTCTNIGATNFVAGDYIVIADCSIDRTGDGHCVRLAGTHYAVLRDNTLTSELQFSSFQVRGANPEPGRDDRPETEYVLVRGNRCKTQGGILPQNDAAVEDVKKVICEGNEWVYPTDEAQRTVGLLINGRDIEVRKNKFWNIRRCIVTSDHSTYAPNRINISDNRGYIDLEPSVDQYLIRVSAESDNVYASGNAYESHGTGTAQFALDLSGGGGYSSDSNLGYFPAKTGSCLDWDGDTDCTDPDWVQTSDPDADGFLELGADNPTLVSVGAAAIAWSAQAATVLYSVSVDGGPATLAWSASVAVVVAPSIVAADTAIAQWSAPIPTAVEVPTESTDYLFVRVLVAY